MAAIVQELASRLALRVDDADRELAGWHLFDFLASALAAARSGETSPFRQVAEASDTGSCTALGVGHRSATGAAMLNAALGMALELDSSDRLGRIHPSPVVFPAALATAETRIADDPDSGRRLLDAIVVGYDATARVGRALGDEHYALFHPTSTAGVFGAAAAAARLRGLDTDLTAHALAIAGSTAGGLWQVRLDNASSKPAHSSIATITGMHSAALAANGVTGPQQVFEGEAGFFASLASHSDPRTVLEELSRPAIHEASLKPWPSCRHTHPAMAAALGVRATVSISDPDDVQKIRVKTYPEALRFTDCPHPIDPGQARFSLQHTVAVMLLRGDFTVTDLDPAELDQPVLREMRSRVTLGVDDEAASIYPAAWGARVGIQDRTGSWHDSHRRHAFGDPEDPLTPDDLQKKWRRCVAGPGAEELGEGVRRALDELLDGAPVRVLSDALIGSAEVLMDNCD